LAYTYDAAGDSTAIADALTSGRSQTIGYDNLNRVASATGLYPPLTNTYDAIGNRLTATSGGTASILAYASTANQVDSVTTGGTTRSFSYLASGQASQDIRDGATDYAYDYDSSGRLATATLNGVIVGTYTYNALGQRVSKTAGPAAVAFIYDSAGHLIEEADASVAVLRDYIWLDDMPVAMIDNTGASPAIYTMHDDHLNRPVRMSDATGAVVWDRLFDPFGNSVSVSGSDANPLSSPGQYYDTET